MEQETKWKVEKNVAYGIGEGDVRGGRIPDDSADRDIGLKVEIKGNQAGLEDEQAREQEQKPREMSGQMGNGGGLNRRGRVIPNGVFAGAIPRGERVRRASNRPWIPRRRIDRSE